ncbi:TPA: DnaJ domain-containing protein [Serratia rubidaea]|nr:DnaJ domain-containing protein [Serratia rubidaea]HDJ1450091.1 DnaJ domain-containing protein [Serratia rubidaea]HDJ1463088.1 DnaJ domain-containing protein [Serratia rubidaea]HDJ2774010.1 DnaJ domain-containing protein [Serratia rubidaea]
MRTHYDNLKVSKDAPVEVIQAAYRTLAKKYHPDKNKDNPEAERIMQIINTAYEILSDPVKREEHDAWIRKESSRNNTESSNAERQKTSGNYKREAPNEKNAPGNSTHAYTSRANQSIKRKVSSNLKFSLYGVVGTLKFSLKCVIVVGLLIGGVKFFEKDFVSDDNSKEVGVSKVNASAETLPAAKVISPNCSGPQFSHPDGRQWPSSAYIMSVRDYNKPGLSSLLLDNSRNNQNLYIKLVQEKDATTKRFTRDAYIPAYQELKLTNVAKGKYFIKMMNVADGCAQISQLINIQETKTNKGIEYSDYSLTFYPVRYGNTHLDSLPSSQF